MRASSRSICVYSFPPGAKRSRKPGCTNTFRHLSARGTYSCVAAPLARLPTLMLYCLGGLKLAAQGEDCTGRKRRIASLRLDFAGSKGRDFAFLRELHDVVEYLCE